MNSMKRTKKIYQFFAVIVATAFISSAITITLSADAPESAPNTVIDWEGLEAYKINGIRYANPDDVDSIQDAIDDMQYGGMLVIPSGNYTVSTTIELDVDKVALVAGGPNTNLIADAALDANIITISGDDNYIGGLAFDGDKANQTVSTYCIQIDSTAESTQVIDCVITQARHSGILVTEGSQFTLISSNTIQDCGVTGGYGFGVYILGQNVTVANNIFRDNYGGGVLLDGLVGAPCRSNIVIGNQISGNSSHGVHIEDAYAHNNSVIGNSIHDLTGVAYGAGTAAGIYVAGYDTLIEGNIVTNVPYKGIALTSGARRGFITGNQVINVGNVGIGTEGSLSTVSENYVFSSGAGGIRADYVLNNIVEYSASTGVVGTLVKNNVIRSNAGYGISIYADYATVEGNTIYSNTGYGVYTGSKNYLTIISNSIYQNDNSGIYVYGSKYSLISNNKAYDAQAVPTQTRGIVETTGADYNQIILNDVRNCSVAGIVTIGANTDVKYNLGYVTENKGTATITASTSVVFNHGLATTPTLVLASFNLASYGNYTWTATTTQITITVSTSDTYTVYWYAEV